MITTVEQARTKRCPEGINETCLPLECMAWEFWIPPPGVAINKRPDHGVPDEEKLGYCGKVMRR